MPTVHQIKVRQNTNFINMLGGKVTNNLIKLPIKSINIPICNNPLTVQSKPNFLMFLQNQKDKPTNINNEIKFVIMQLR